jgi:hypothetical protein
MPAGTPHRVEERKRPDLERVREALNEHDERTEQEASEPPAEPPERDGDDDEKDPGEGA